jgi:hypothetical protein
MKHPRIGTFFLLVGLVLLILFLGTVLSKHVNINLLGASLVVFLFAHLFRRRISQDSGRFRTIRRVSENSRKRREEREQEEASRDE